MLGFCTYSAAKKRERIVEYYYVKEERKSFYFTSVKNVSTEFSSVELCKSSQNVSRNK